jgi:hypothetical protein
MSVEEHMSHFWSQNLEDDEDVQLMTQALAIQQEQDAYTELYNGLGLGPILAAAQIPGGLFSSKFGVQIETPLPAASCLTGGDEFLAPELLQQDEPGMDASKLGTNPFEPSLDSPRNRINVTNPVELGGQSLCTSNAQEQLEEVVSDVEPSQLDLNPSPHGQLHFTHHVDELDGPLEQHNLGTPNLKANRYNMDGFVVSRSKSSLSSPSSTKVDRFLSRFGDVNEATFHCLYTEAAYLHDNLEATVPSLREEICRLIPELNEKYKLAFGRFKKQERNFPALIWSFVEEDYEDPLLLKKMFTEEKEAKNMTETEALFAHALTIVLTSLEPNENEWIKRQFERRRLEVMNPHLFRNLRDLINREPVLRAVILNIPRIETNYVGYLKERERVSTKTSAKPCSNPHRPFNDNVFNSLFTPEASKSERDALWRFMFSSGKSNLSRDAAIAAVAFMDVLRTESQLLQDICEGTYDIRTKAKRRRKSTSSITYL